VPLKAVLDTNVLISATGWRGALFHCVELARSGKIESVTCNELLLEYAEKLEVRLAFSKKDADDAVAELLKFVRIISIPGKIHGVTKDLDDDMVFECAFEGGVDYIVTGDKGILAVGNFHGIRVVQAAEFLKLALIT